MREFLADGPDPGGPDDPVVRLTVEDMARIAAQVAEEGATRIPQVRDGLDLTPSRLGLVLGRDCLPH